MLKRYVFKCFLNIVTLGEHLIPSGKVFHSVAAAVSINRLPSFTVLLLLGTVVYVFISSNMLHLYQNLKFPLYYQCKVLHVVCI